MFNVFVSVCVFCVLMFVLPVEAERMSISSRSELGMNLVADDASIVTITMTKTYAKTKYVIAMYDSLGYECSANMNEVTCKTIGEVSQRYEINYVIEEADMYGVYSITAGKVTITKFRFAGYLTIVAFRGVSLHRSPDPLMSSPYIRGLDITLEYMSSTTDKPVDPFECVIDNSIDGGGDLGGESFAKGEGDSEEGGSLGTSHTYDSDGELHRSYGLEDEDDEVTERFVKINWCFFKTLKIKAKSANVKLYKVTAKWALLSGENSCHSIINSTFSHLDDSINNTISPTSQTSLHEIFLENLTYEYECQITTKGYADVTLSFIKGVDPLSTFAVTCINSNGGLINYVTSVTYFTNIDTDGEIKMMLNSPSLEYGKSSFIGYTAIYYTIITAVCPECGGIQCDCSPTDLVHSSVGEINGTYNAPMYLNIRSTSNTAKSTSVIVYQNLFQSRTSYKMIDNEGFTFKFYHDNVFVTSYDSLAMTNSYLLLDDSDNIRSLKSMGGDERKISIIMYQYSHNYYVNSSSEQPADGGKYKDNNNSEYSCSCLRNVDRLSVSCSCPSQSTYTWSTALVILPDGFSDITLFAPEAEYFVAICMGASVRYVGLDRPSLGYFEFFDVLDGIHVNSQWPGHGGDRPEMESRLIEEEDPDKTCLIVLLASNSRHYDFSSGCSVHNFMVYGIENGVRVTNTQLGSNIKCFDNLKPSKDCLTLLNSNTYGNIDTEITVSSKAHANLYVVTCEDRSVDEKQVIVSSSAFTYGIKDYTGSTSNITQCGPMKITSILDGELISYLKEYDFIVTFVNNLTVFDLEWAYIRGLTSNWVRFERANFIKGISIYMTEFETETLAGNMSRMSVFWLNSTDVDVTANVGRLQLSVCPGEDCFSGSYEVISPHPTITDNSPVSFVAQDSHSTSNRKIGYISSFKKGHSIKMTAKADYAKLMITNTTVEYVGADTSLELAIIVSVGVGVITIPLLVKFWCLKKKKDTYRSASSADRDFFDVTYTTSGGTSTT